MVDNKAKSIEKEHGLILAALNLDGNHIEHILAGESQAVRDRLYGLIKQLGQGSEWAARVQFDKQTKTLARINDSFEKLLNQREAQGEKAVQENLMLIDDPATRIEYVKKWTQSKESTRKAFKNHVDNMFSSERQRQSINIDRVLNDLETAAALKKMVADLGTK